MSEKLKVAVITGWHPYDAVNFIELFRSIEGIEFYPQDIENFALDWGQVRTEYDVLLYYNMNMGTPKEDGEGFEPAVYKAIMEMGETEQGVLFLHHSILAYPGIKKWSDMVGIADRTFDYHLDQEYKAVVEKPEHPIMEGVSDFSVQDETYTMAEPDSSCEVLLTTDHDPSMQALAWTREYQKSRVFCYQLGHDKLSWENPSFRRILSNGIQWCAGK